MRPPLCSWPPLGFPSGPDPQPHPAPRWTLPTLGILLLALLSACARSSPTLTPTVTPTPPEWLVVAHPTELLPVDAALGACARAQGLSLQVHETAPGEHPADATLLLTLGAPPADAVFAYQVGAEHIWAIGNQQNPLRALSRDTLHDLFLGQIRNWRALGGPPSPVMVFAPASGLSRQALDTLLEGLPPYALAQAVPDPIAALEVVAESPGGLSLLPGAWLRAPIEALPPTVQETRPSARVLSAEPLAQAPLVGYGYTPLTPTVRGLLACLQTRLQGWYPAP